MTYTNEEKQHFHDICRKYIEEEGWELEVRYATYRATQPDGTEIDMPYARQPHDYIIRKGDIETSVKFLSAIRPHSSRPNSYRVTNPDPDVYFTTEPPGFYLVYIPTHKFFVKLDREFFRPRWNPNTRRFDSEPHTTKNIPLDVVASYRMLAGDRKWE